MLRNTGEFSAKKNCPMIWADSGYLQVTLLPRPSEKRASITTQKVTNTVGTEVPQVAVDQAEIASPTEAPKVTAGNTNHSTKEGMDGRGKGHPDEDEFSLDIWANNLGGIPLDGLNFAPPGLYAPQQPHMRASTSYSDKRSRPNGEAGIKGSDEQWTLDAVSDYVQAELSSFSARLTQLETIVQQIATRLEMTDGEHADASIGTPTPPHHRRKEITRGHLDRYCLPVLERTVEPGTSVLSRIVQQLSMLYDHMDRKTILSQVRKWFRKRREEMGARLASSLRRRNGQLLQESHSVQKLREELEEGQFCLELIITDAKLEISDVNEANNFARQKLLGFLERYKPDV